MQQRSNTDEPKVVVARNAHPNETSAYEFAEKVYLELDQRGYEVTLETRSTYPISAHVVQEHRSGPSLEASKENIIYCGSWENNVAETYPDAEVFSFHNYPINDLPLNKEDKTVAVDPDEWKKTRFRDQVRSQDSPYQFIEFTPEDNPYVIEIPAIYETDLHSELISAMEDDDPLNNLWSQAGYLLSIDQETSGEHGFLSDDVPEIIADSIENIVVEQDAQSAFNEFNLAHPI